MSAKLVNSIDDCEDVEFINVFAELDEACCVDKTGFSALSVICVIIVAVSRFSTVMPVQVDPMLFSNKVLVLESSRNELYREPLKRAGSLVDF